MTRGVLMAGLLAALLGAPALAAEATGGDVPEALAPFGYLIGAWKGAGIPTANKLRGWNEKHMWAWKFAKGVPIGLSIEFQGDKTLAKGQLTYDEAKKQYTLQGTDPAGKPATFVGTLDKKGKTLTLVRQGKADAAKERLTLFPNANKVRYTIWIDHKEAGSPQFHRLTEVGVTKEGESFAASGASANLPKCILTGGTATLTVSFQGKSFPVCCTGCRDEFNDNPEKYVKKAALRAEKEAKKSGGKPAASRAKDDGAFDGLLDEPKKK